MNKVVLIGRLTKDTEVRYAKGDSVAVARYSLAVDRRTKDGGTDFINCVAFGKSAEFAGKYFFRGMKVAVIGHIQTGSYKNKEGHMVYTTDVVIEEQEFCESKKANEEKPAIDDFIAVPDEIGEELPFV